MLCCAVWAVIKHGEPKKVPDSGMGSQDRLLAGSHTDAETEDKEERSVLSRGKNHTKARAEREREQGALHQLNIPLRKLSPSPGNLVQRSVPQV